MKKAHKRYRRLLPAFAMCAVLAGTFALLYTRALLGPAVRPSASPSAVETPLLTAQPDPAATPEPTPAPPRIRVYSRSARPDGRVALARADLLTWGVDVRLSADLVRHCRFSDGGGNLLDDYKWGDLVPESEAVEDEFFSDAVFIGNSLEQGFMIYSGLRTADMYATQSITVDNIFYEKAVNVGEGEYITILDAMARRSHGKVYIMLGLNEISYSKERFSQLYGRLVDRIRELQPEAELYLQGMTPVTARQSASGSVFNNERIRAYNEVIRALAGDKQAHFINVYEALADEEGNLPAGASFDGIHPYAKYYEAWYTYLKTHTVLEVSE